MSDPKSMPYSSFIAPRRLDNVGHSNRLHPQCTQHTHLPRKHLSRGLGALNGNVAIHCRVILPARLALFLGRISRLGLRYRSLMK